MAARRKAEPKEAAIIRAKMTTGYKISYGSFERRNEAILAVQQCAKKGARGYIAIKKNRYTVEFGEYESREAAEKAREEIASAGIDAEMTERE